MRTIALIGDFDIGVPAHDAIPKALDLWRRSLQLSIAWQWVSTDEVLNPDTDLSKFAGLWAVPGSPYASMEGVLCAIRYVREFQIPFLGTCGGFQHALIEFARNVLGISGADHAETNATASDLVVTRLACSLVEQRGTIVFSPGSVLDVIFGGKPTVEGYRCNYGPNSAFREKFSAAGMRFTGFDDYGEIRAAELAGHPFFIGTLFQPERSALLGILHPLVGAFVKAVAAFE